MENKHHEAANAAIVTFDGIYIFLRAAVQIHRQTKKHRIHEALTVSLHLEYRHGLP